MTSETDMDVKLELKTVMDKIRTLSMGKNKETTVSWILILRLLFCTVMEHSIYLLLPRDLKSPVNTINYYYHNLLLHKSVKVTHDIVHVQCHVYQFIVVSASTAGNASADSWTQGLRKLYGAGTYTVHVHCKTRRLEIPTH